MSDAEAIDPFYDATHGASGNAGAIQVRLQMARLPPSTFSLPTTLTFGGGGCVLKTWCTHWVLRQAKPGERECHVDNG
jgi:hypothetical protein